MYLYYNDNNNNDTIVNLDTEQMSPSLTSQPAPLGEANDYGKMGAACLDYPLAPSLECGRDR